MPEQPDIFRKVALDRLSSPEQLDQLMRVTSSQGWVALVSLGVVLVLCVLWGVFGSIHTKVNGQGILIKGGRVYDVVSLGAGVVTQIHARVGMQVDSNQLIAVLDQPELQLRIGNTQSNLAELRGQHELLLDKERQTLVIETHSLRQERTNLLVSITNYQALIAKLEEKQARQQEAVRNELLIPAALLATEIDIFNARQDRARAEQRLLQIEALEISRPTEIQQVQTARQQRIEETGHALRLLEQQFRLSSEIRSSHRGTVLELVVDPGSYITAGSRVLSLETPDLLEAVIFTPPDQGKRIRPRFQVQLSPRTVKREEAGFMRATVESVSPFPSTPERLMRVLRNQDLVEQLSGMGAPIEVRVTLDRDEAGRYIWSSARQRPEVTSGTLCDASFLVGTNRPIELVLPVLRESVGL